MIVVAARNRISSRCGKGAPLDVVRGRDSAAASERYFEVIDAEATIADCHLVWMDSGHDIPLYRPRALAEILTHHGGSNPRPQGSPPAKP